MAVALPKRSEVEEKYTWNLASIFPAVDDWRATLKKVEDSLAGLGEYKGHLGDSAQKLLGWFTPTCVATRILLIKRRSPCATRREGCSLASTRRYLSQNRSYLISHARKSSSGWARSLSLQPTGTISTCCAPARGMCVRPR